MKASISYNNYQKTHIITVKKCSLWWLWLLLLLLLLILLLKFCVCKPHPVIVPPIKPPEQNVNPPQKNVAPPKKGCRAFFTGLVVCDYQEKRNFSEIYVIDDYSEYVGEGEYPENTKAFPKSVEYTFDGIAIDRGTRVIIFSEPNFKGDTLLDKTGPAIINNSKWEFDDRYAKANSKNFKPEFQKDFPQSVREWSKTDMHDWSYGSVKIICNKQ